MSGIGSEKKEFKSMMADNPEIAELQEIFKQYKEMYQLPGVSLETVEKNFQRGYLSSVRMFRESEEVLRKGDELGSLEDAHNIKPINLHNFKEIPLTLDSKFDWREIVYAIRSVSNLQPSVDYDVRDMLVYFSEHEDERIVTEVLKKISVAYYFLFEEKKEIFEKFFEDKRVSVRTEAKRCFYYNLNQKEKGDFLSKWKDDLDNNEYTHIKEMLTWLKVKLLSMNIEDVQRTKYVEQYITLYEQYNNVLYKNHLDEQNGIRGEFIKSGGIINTLGGKFLGNIIVRQLYRINFNVWRKAYENAEVWEKNGFDYVPIEPIYSFRISKEYKLSVEVRTGVLGMTVAEYKTLAIGRHESYLEKQMTRIYNILKKRLGIQFDKYGTGHFREANFCLRWERLDNSDKNSPINWRKPPRIYLIDWDHAGELD
jgi:hypothetical protein